MKKFEATETIYEFIMVIWWKLDNLNFILLEGKVKIHKSGHIIICWPIWKPKLFLSSGNQTTHFL